MPEILDTIYEAADCNQITAMLSNDESAAFDCVNIDMLTRKMELYKFSKNTIS